MRSPSPCANLYNTRLDTPQAMCALHVALRGIHPRAKMRRSFEQSAEKVRQREKGWPGESPVLAQRAASEGPRWTRAVGDSSWPSWGNVYEQARMDYLELLTAILLGERRVPGRRGCLGRLRAGG